MAELRTGERVGKILSVRFWLGWWKPKAWDRNYLIRRSQKKFRWQLKWFFLAVFTWLLGFFIFSECFPHINCYIRLMFSLETSISAILKMFSLIWTGVSLGQQHSGQCGISLHHHPEKFSLLSYSPYLPSFIHLPVQLFIPTASEEKHLGCKFCRLCKLTSILTDYIEF